MGENKMKKKEISAQELVRNIREILTYILMIAIYVLIWYFVYKVANDDITFWGTIICFAIGWAIMSWYENENYILFPMNKFYKFLGAIVVIPLLVGTGVNMLIDYVLKEDEQQIETKTDKKVQQTTRPRTADEILKEVNVIENKYNNTPSYNSYGFNTEEYECERCFKKISEEEFELYDGMCEECFDETHYDFNGNPREDYWNY